jgi:hypothetical protein
MSVAGAVQQNPDEFAQAKQLGAAIGVPPEIVARIRAWIVAGAMND